jgi:ABC-type multidrug transport system ATPase subunit
MIELLGLHKVYGARAILSDASLTVRAGETIALVGANGSGKTTTLRCAVGLARPTSGRVLIDGIDATARPCDSRARLGYLAQRTGFPATLTVREILSVVAALRGADARTVEREISLCGLTQLAGRTVGQLSGGERQRIAIAALFVPDVSTYLLDEPTMNLDPIGVRLLVDRLAAARDEGRAVLFTTHTAAELDDLATGVALLRDGHIVAVAEDVERGERHMSIAIDGGAEPWLSAALRAGARRAWAGGARLHAIVADRAVSPWLSQLECDGARVTNYRSESALAAALERLNEEEHDDEVARPHGADRCVAAGQLWRGAAWARADSAGPR